MELDWTWRQWKLEGEWRLLSLFNVRLKIGDGQEPICYATVFDIYSRIEWGLLGMVFKEWLAERRKRRNMKRVAKLAKQFLPEDEPNDVPF